MTDTPWITFQIVPDPAPDTDPDPVPGSAVVNSGNDMFNYFQSDQNVHFHLIFLKH